MNTFTGACKPSTKDFERLVKKKMADTMEESALNNCFAPWTSPQVCYKTTHTYTLNKAQAPSGRTHSNIIISSHLHQTKAKVKTITEAPAPKNVAEFHSFLGLINYYGKFLPNLSPTLVPINYCNNTPNGTGVTLK